MTDFDEGVMLAALGVLCTGLFFGGPLGITLAILAACAGSVWLVLALANPIK